MSIKKTDIDTLMCYSWNAQFIQNVNAFYRQGTWIEYHLQIARKSTRKQACTTYMYVCIYVRPSYYL